MHASGQPSARHAVIDGLYRPDQRVPLLAERELDHAFRREVREVSSPSRRRPSRRSPLMPPPLIWRLRLSGRLDEAGEHAGIEHAEPSIELCGRTSMWAGWRRSRPLRMLRAPSPPRDRRPCAHAPRCRLGGEHLLRLVQLRALELGELADLIETELGEQLRNRVRRRPRCSARYCQ